MLDAEGAHLLDERGVLRADLCQRQAEVGLLAGEPCLVDEQGAHVVGLTLSSLSTARITAGRSRAPSPV